MRRGKERLVAAVFIFLAIGVIVPLGFVGWAIITHDSSKVEDPFVADPALAPITREGALAEFKEKNPCHFTKTAADQKRCDRYHEYIDRASELAATYDEEGFDPADYENPLPP